ncbi:hypothetical protein ACVE84_002620 [Escherichia albertii]
MRRLTRLIQADKEHCSCRPDKAFTPHPADAPECLMRRLTVLSGLQSALFPLAG